MIEARQSEKELLEQDRAALRAQPLALVPHSELRMRSKTAHRVVAEWRHGLLPIAAIWIAGKPYARACDLERHLATVRNT